MLIKLNKYKKFIIDLIINTFSFAIYIIAQQLVLMPIMGKLLSEESFASFILFISIFSIISNSLGSELGIVRQIREDENKSGIYNKILTIMLVFIFLISIIFLYFLHYSFLEILLLSLIIVFANLRLYAGAFFRMKKEFKKIFFQNLLYLFGIIVGILFYKKSNHIWIPSMFAEIFSLCYSFLYTDLKYMFKFDENNIDKGILKSFKDYGIIEFLINMITYFDKILIYPILGTNAVNVYYSTSTMSKLFSLITNPLHGVILSWLKKDESKTNEKIIKLCLKYCLPVVFIISILCIPTTYFAIKILYSQYLQQSLIIIIPISISVGFTFVTSIIKAVLLKFVESKKLLKTYVFYLIIFICFSIVFSKFLGLIGFALSILISRIGLLVMFLVILNNLSLKEKNINE